MCKLHYFYLAHTSLRQSAFLNFEHYPKIINLLYLNHEPVDSDKTLRFKCDIKKVNCFVEEFFSFYVKIFRVKELFLRRNFGQIYEVVNNY